MKDTLKFLNLTYFVFWQLPQEVLYQNDIIDVVLMSLLLTLNISHLFVVFLLLSLEFGCVFVYWVLTLGSFKMYVTSKMAFFIPPCHGL